MSDPSLPLFPPPAPSVNSKHRYFTYILGHKHKQTDQQVGQEHTLQAFQRVSGHLWR